MILFSEHGLATTEQTLTQQIIDRRDRYMSINYPRYPIAMVRGEGCYLEDAEGKRYLDLFAGFGAGLLGHCHPDLVRTITEQANKLWHPGNLMHTEPQTLLAERIACHGFGGRSFFCHSGADANEAAIKLARLYGKARPGADGKRYKVISANDSFHGRSFGTMLATGQQKAREGFDPFLPGFVNVAYNDLMAIKHAIDVETVAVIIEPIQGEGGVNVPDDDYLPRLRELCNEHDLLMICDEVWTGCGRTGRYFAYQHWGIEPDIMTLAKGVGGGLAVGVMCAKPHIAELYNCNTQGGVKHATTLGGNCLSMAVSVTIFDLLNRHGLVEHAAELGQWAMERLRRFAQHCPTVKDVRGKGLMIGIELNPQAQGSSFNNVNEVVERCMGCGVLTNATQGAVLRLSPPVIISQSQMEEGLDVIERAIST